jgi:DNA (cytosine-5)-methyltransferase 1
VSAVRARVISARAEEHSSGENNVSKPVVVELFAGAGGLMLGLEMSGFRTIVANEVHPDPCKTLRYNFPNVPVVEGSIRDLTGSDLLRAANYEGEIDLVAGGPPCQGFSTAGKKDPADPRNTLIGDFLRIVGELRPKAFMLENVTGLVTMHGGSLFEGVLAQIEALGYKYTWRIIFAPDYGLPQMRKRLVVLGSRDGEPPTFPEPSHFKPGMPTPLFGGEPYVSVSDALSDLPEIAEASVGIDYRTPPATSFQRLMRERPDLPIKNHQSSKHRPETMAYYALIPPGGTALDIPIELRNGKQGVQRWPNNGLSRTITTEPTDFLHPSLNRVPTVRETARIQSFPDWFEFLGQRTTGNKMRRLGYCSQTQQVGNAVPPLLAKAIGESLLNWLNAGSASERKAS